MRFAAPVLVSLLVLAACGDDTSTTGATSGGDGGAGEGGSTTVAGPGSTSTVTSGGQTTTTATTTGQGGEGAGTTGQGGEGGFGEGGGTTGQGGDGGFGTGGDGGAGTTTATTAATTAATTTASTTTGGPGDCTAITVEDFIALGSDGAAAVYSAPINQALGGVEDDELRVEFYGDPLNGGTAGTFDLSMSGDDNYATCARCFRAFEDASVVGSPQYFQSGGSLTIAAGSAQLDGTIDATITDLTLVEVTIATDGSFVSTPVPNGACLYLASAPVVVEAEVVPPGWTCDPDWYGSADTLGLCDCGCGAQDTTCDSTTDVGECTDNCPVGFDVDPTDTTQCIASGGGDLELSYAGAAVPVTDDTPAGICVDLISSTAGTVASINSVGVAVTHSWAGDLVFRLVSPGGTSVTLMDRPGVPASMFGDSSSFIASSPIAFETDATVSAEDIGVSAGNGDVCLADGVCTFFPQPGLLADFADDAASGTWQFCASDNSGGDTGSIIGVTVSGTLN